MSLLSLAGGLVGGLIAGPGGAAVGATVGGTVAGGGGNASQVYTAQTPSGPINYTYTGSQPVSQSAGAFFDSLAKSGNFTALNQIAGTGSGPDWRNPSATFSGYGTQDRNWASQLVAAYRVSSTGAATGATAAATTVGPSTPSTLQQLGSAIDRGLTTTLATAEQQAGAILTGAGLGLVKQGTSGAQQSSLVPTTSLQTIGVVVLVVLVIVAVVAAARR